MNLAPNFGALEPVLPVLDNTPMSYEFSVVDPNVGDTVSVTAAGLPGGVTLVQVDATTWKLVGDPGAANVVHEVELVASDDASPPASTTVTIKIVVELYQRSNLAGQLVISEVLYSQSSSIVYDEFIEIRNLGPDPVPLTGLRIVDANLRVEGEDPDPPGVAFDSTAWDLDGTLGSTDLSGNLSVLNENETALLWLRYDEEEPDFPWFTPAKLHYNLQTSSLTLPALDNDGDDVWILEADERSLIAYVAWGGPASVELGTPPPASLGLWESSNQVALNDLRSGESIALATAGTGSEFSQCWEVNSTGTANEQPAANASAGSCPEPTGITKDKDTFPLNRDSSAGRSNL